MAVRFMQTADVVTMLGVRVRFSKKISPRVVDPITLPNVEDSSGVSTFISSQCRLRTM
jgi:hypothetical protein